MPYAQGQCYAQSYVYSELDFSVDDAGKISFVRVKETKKIAVDATKVTHTSDDENADVDFVNSSGVRTYFTLGGESQRNITRANVYEMFPFDNLVYVFELTYEDLLSVFKYSMTSTGKGSGLMAGRTEP